VNSGTPTLPRRWPRPRVRTLRTRVTLVASVSITAAIVLGAVAIYLLQIQSVRRTIDSQLRTYAIQIAQSGGGGTWPRTLAPSSLDPNSQAQVIAADGHVLAATRTLAGLPAVYLLPPGSDTPVRQKAADGVVPGEVRVVALRTTVRHHPVTIVTATSTGLLNHVNADFAEHLVIVLPVILIVAAGVIWLVVGWALRPVDRIRRAVTSITSAGLSQRVPEPGTSDEIEHLAKTMNDMLTRLDDASRRERRFVADASHELRSPLAAIRTTLEVGLAHPDRAPWPVIADRAVRQSVRLEDLIQQLLLLAKADERLLAAQWQPVDLGQLLHGIHSSVLPHRPGLSLDLAPGVVTEGNPEHLERLFRNVVENALRFARTSVVVRATSEAATVRVEVLDDGPGIPAAERERIFDRFVRLDSSRERGSGTTGLGLAIAYEIATAHHGHITAAGRNGEGARIVITLPRATAKFQDGPA
jgi:signal transduction histidine kinase